MWAICWHNDTRATKPRGSRVGSDALIGCRRGSRRNFERKLPLRVAALAALLQSLTVVPSGTERGCQLGLLVKDRPVFEFALRVKATQLLTGDLKDFGVFMIKRNKTEGVLIQTMGKFLNSVVQGS